MQRSENRILTTHAGSLPRPRALQEMHGRKFRGEAVDEATLAEAVEAATRDSIDRQVAAGVDIGNNGEQGRENFFTYLQHRMTGFGGESERPVMRDMTAYPGYVEMLARMSRNEGAVSALRAPKALSEVRYIDRAPIEHECAELRRLLAERDDGFTEAFVSAPSPGIIASAMLNEHYPSFEAYVDALSEALRNEYEAIVDAGFLLQIDAPDLALERHTSFADRPLRDFLGFVEMVVAAINRALANIPHEKVRLHVCWGNYEGPHDHDVALDDIYPEIARANAGALMLSMANPRHAHDYHCFETHKLPDDALLIAGVIDTTTNYVEHPLTVADRIKQIARAVGDPHRVLAGTDCGFETSAGVAFVAPDIVWAKLAVLAEGAKIASKDLFG